MKEKDVRFRKSPRDLLEMPDPAPSMFINDISRLFRKTIHQTGEVENVSPGYRRMFSILCAQDGLTQQELATAAKLAPPSVSAALNKMEEQGFVKRVHDTKDRRRVMVYITEKGRQQEAIVRERFFETDKKLMRGISQEERQALNATLRKLLRNLLEEGDE